MASDRRRTWDDRHASTREAGTPSTFVVEALAALAASSPPLVSGRALDLACGRGRHALFAAAHGWRIDAVDFSLPALTALRREASTQNADVRCLAADVGVWPIPKATYALVLVVSFLDRAIFPALRAAVAPGGALVYETYLRTDDAPSAVRPELCLRPGELETLCRDWDVILRRDERGWHRGVPAVRAAIAARRPATPH